MFVRVLHKILVIKTRSSHDGSVPTFRSVFPSLHRVPTLKMEIIGPYETSVNFCPTKRSHIPQATFDVGVVYIVSFTMRTKFRAGTRSEFLLSKMLIKFNVCFLHIQKEGWPDLITEIKHR